MSTDQEKLKGPDHTTPMTVPADVNTDMNHFKDTDRQDLLRQQLDKELHEAPWNKDASHQALEQMERLSKLSSQYMNAFGIKMTVTSLKY